MSNKKELLRAKCDAISLTFVMDFCQTEVFELVYTEMEKEITKLNVDIRLLNEEVRILKELLNEKN